MRILIVGATGYIGSAVAARLKADGHEIFGLARSEAAATALAGAGIEPVAGDLHNTEESSRTVAGFDGTVLCAMPVYDEEEQVVAPLLNAIRNNGRFFLFTSGTAVLSQPAPEGQWNEQSFAEDDPFVPPAGAAARARTEALVRAAASEGARAMVIRPPMVWGNGGSRQVPAIFESIEKRGAACYVGRGLNCYSHVHVDDLAELYRLVLEAGESGALYHAVAGEENWRTLAQAVASVKGCEARSIDGREARAIWGDRAERYFMVCSRSRSPRARRELGWQPRQVDLFDDIVNGSYRDRFGWRRT